MTHFAERMLPRWQQATTVAEMEVALARNGV